MKKQLLQCWSRITLSARPMVTMTTNKFEGETLRIAVAWIGGGRVFVDGTTLANNERYATEKSTFSHILVPTDGKLKLMVSGKAELVYLCCSDNKLKRLDVAECASLEWLDCADNELKSLNVANCSVLRRLICTGNKLSSLDLISCLKLEVESIQQLQAQDCRCIIKKSTIGNTNVLAVMMTTKPAGQTIRITAAWSGTGSVAANGQVLTNNTKYATESCFSDEILVPLGGNIELLASGDAKLILLLCYASQLTGLDVANCTALKLLSCSNNQLKHLDLSNCVELTELDCSYNLLRSLNAKNSVKLKVLNYSYNSMGSKDVKAIRRF